MTEPFTFTKATLQVLRPSCKQYEVRDSKTPGLVCRVNPAGSKTYMFYRKVDGKNIRIKIGRVSDITIEQARQKTEFLNGQIVSGIRPHEILKEKRQEPTFSQLYARYYKEHAVPHTKRPDDNKAMIDLHITPQIGAWRTGDITKEKMKEIHRRMGKDSGKHQANRALDMTSAVFNFGIREDIFTGNNPCVGIKRYKRTSRDRFLNKNELTIFFKALAHEDQIYQDFFMLSLFIGARKSTMLAMKYSELDLDLKRWRLSEKQSKNDDVNIYVLSDAAIEILQRRKAENENSVRRSEWVFPGRGATGHLADPKKAHGRIKKRMDVTDIRIHDLRRTLGSYMAINNSSLSIIGKALNHKSQAATEIYARLSYDPVSDAVNTANELMLENHKANTYTVPQKAYRLSCQTVFRFSPAVI